MPDDHKTVALSITASLASAGIILLSISLFDGGSPSPDLVLRFVVPLLIASLTLSLFWMLLFLRNRMTGRAAKVPAIGEE